jgi:hypothetical protein
MRSKKFALPVRRCSGKVGRRRKSGGRGASLGCSRVTSSARNIRRHFQGTFYKQRDPGLKPWAVLFGRFAAKSDKPRRDGVICLVMSTCAWPPPNLVPAARLFEKVRVK